jgi:hypothetical protein
MKQTTLCIAAVCSTLLAGCNQLNRTGSQSMVFDSDPFVQLDEEQTMAANQAPPTGRVSVGNINNSMQNAYQAQSQQAAATASYSYNAGGSPDVAAMYAPQQPAVATQQMPNFQRTPQLTPTPQPGISSSPASRAAAEAAAMLAQAGRQPQHIHQMSHEVASPASSGIVNADFQPDPFEQSPVTQSHMMTPGGVVPMPPEAMYNPTSDQFELSASDLELPNSQPATDSRFFPGTNIPLPTGRANLGDILPADWEPTPTPVPEIATSPVQTTPVFSPPKGADAVPVAPSEVREAGPIIRDSTSQSKWRAARRM